MPLLTVPLSGSNRRQAEEFAKQCQNIEKSQQIYLNTLAVCAVNFYFQFIEIETDLEASYSWDNKKQNSLDVADLYVKNLGRLECRPILTGTKVCQIPLEVLEDRIGYLVVLISESFRKATILGFSQSASRYLDINQLQRVEDLIEYLETLSSRVPVKIPVNLSQWFQNVFEASWQSIEALLGTDTNLGYETRYGSVRRAKLIDSEMQLGCQSVALVVGITTLETDRVGVRVQLHPASRDYLPPNLKLVLLSESGNTLQEVQSRSQDNWIQLKKFKCPQGKGFKVQVFIDDFSILEDFII